MKRDQSAGVSEGLSVVFNQDSKLEKMMNNSV